MRARLRPDQITNEQEAGVMYCLSELFREAQENASFYPDEMRVQKEHWEMIVIWLQNQIRLANGINPFTGDEFTDREIAMMRMIDEAESFGFET